MVRHALVLSLSLSFRLDVRVLRAYGRVPRALVCMYSGRQTRGQVEGCATCCSVAGTRANSRMSPFGFGCGSAHETAHRRNIPPVGIAITMGRVSPHTHTRTRAPSLRVAHPRRSSSSSSPLPSSSTRSPAHLVLFISLHRAPPLDVRVHTLSLLP